MLEEVAVFRGGGVGPALGAHVGRDEGGAPVRPADRPREADGPVGVGRRPVHPALEWPPLVFGGRLGQVEHDALEEEQARLVLGGVEARPLGEELIEGAFDVGRLGALELGGRRDEAVPRVGREVSFGRPRRERAEAVRERAQNQSLTSQRCGLGG